MLATRTRGSVGVDPQILLLDLWCVVELLHERRHLQGGEARLAPVLGVERAHPNQTVHPSLCRQEPVGEPSLDDEGGREEAGFGALGRLIDLDAEPTTLSPAGVHPQHHLGPVLGVGPAGPRVHLCDGICLVVLPLKEALHLEATDGTLEITNRSGQLLLERSVWLSGAGSLADELDHDLGITQARGEGVEAIKVIAHPTKLGGDLSGPILVIPEIRLPGELLELVSARSSIGDLEVPLSLGKPRLELREHHDVGPALAGALRPGHGRV